jgi:O-acetyl-ADP-ribose deacetylase (regulator of RNase III)
MISYSEVPGNLISMALKGNFDVIGHGCNCLSTMGAGIAPQMASTFGCDKFPMELQGPDIGKLGKIDYQHANSGGHDFHVVNIYSQYSYATRSNPKPFDYLAFTTALGTMNEVFKGKHIGLPKIGAGLAGGDWNRIKEIIQTQLKDCKVTVVLYDGK